MLCWGSLVIRNEFGRQYISIITNWCTSVQLRREYSVYLRFKRSDHTGPYFLPLTYKTKITSKLQQRLLDSKSGIFIGQGSLNMLPLSKFHSPKLRAGLSFPHSLLIKVK